MNAQNYFYRDKSGNEIGPLALDTLAKFRQAGVLDATTPVRAENSSEWRNLHEIVAADQMPATSAPQPKPSTPLNQPNWKGSWTVGVVVIVISIIIVFALRTSNSPKRASQSSTTASGVAKVLQSQMQSHQGLQLGTVYQSSRPFVIQSGGSFLFSSTIYIFSDRGVSVYYTVSTNGDILQRKTDGAIITGDDSSARGWNHAVGGFQKGATLTKGNDPTPLFTVVFGPGDRMPVLQNAPYKIKGTSVWVDWSQAHSSYFTLSGANSGSEVWTIKNDGLVLESATSPGFTLTAASSGIGQ